MSCAASLATLTSCFLAACLLAAHKSSVVGAQKTHEGCKYKAAGPLSQSH